MRTLQVSLPPSASPSALPLIREPPVSDPSAHGEDEKRREGKEDRTERTDRRLRWTTVLYKEAWSYQRLSEGARLRACVCWWTIAELAADAGSISSLFLCDCVSVSLTCLPSLHPPHLPTCCHVLVPARFLHPPLSPQLLFHPSLPTCSSPSRNSMASCRWETDSLHVALVLFIISLSLSLSIKHTFLCETSPQSHHFTAR